jgi:hypothetical protein
MYVQYWIPETLGTLPPVIMVHGSSHTGKTYETTPDGREGWATYIVLVHSMSGTQGIGVSVARPTLVKALVTVEALTCTAPDPDVAKTFNHIALLAVWGDFKDAFIDRGLAQCGNLVARSNAAGGKSKAAALARRRIRRQ